MTDWQPIETAPKDGTPILLFTPGVRSSAVGPVGVGRWVESQTVKYGRIVDDRRYWLVNGLVLALPHDKPSHWMPLPPPPRGDPTADQKPSPGPGSGRVAEVVIKDGEVAAVVVSNPGGGYTHGSVVSPARPDAEIKMALSEPIFWTGCQWAVTSYGLEARDGTYAIEKERLLELDWESHMFEKEWVDFLDFAVALAMARMRFFPHGGPVKPQTATAGLNKRA
jgi:hypothetical protein